MGPHGAHKGPDKPANQRTAPIERQSLTGALGRKRQGVGLHQVVRHQTGDRDLGPDVDEYAQGAKGEPGLLQQAESAQDTDRGARSWMRRRRLNHTTSATTARATAMSI